MLETKVDYIAEAVDEIRGALEKLASANLATRIATLEASDHDQETRLTNLERAGDIGRFVVRTAIASIPTVAALLAIAWTTHQLGWWQ